MMESVLKPAHKSPNKKQHWLIWLLVAVVIGAAAVIIYFAQSGQFFKGQAELPISQGPIFYVVDTLDSGHCDIASAPIGSTNCPFEGMEAAYNYVVANPQINPVELRLASGMYLLQDVMEFENRRVSIHGSYDSSSFTEQNFNNVSVLRSTIKITNCSGQISGLSTFNGETNDGPYIEVDNTGSAGNSFQISNIFIGNSGFPSLIKYSANNGSDQAVIQNMSIVNGRATNGSIIEINGPGDVLVRNNFITGSSANKNAIIYAEDNVKIVNNAIVNTPPLTDGVYTNDAIEIKGGMDAKLINNTFADNKFNGPVVKQESADDYFMLIANNLILGSKYMFNVPNLSNVAARGNYWDIPPTGLGETTPIYGISKIYNDRCDPKLNDNRNKTLATAYKLGAGSDCIDKGIKSAAILNLSSPDYFGITRPSGVTVDPGYSEYSAELFLSMQFAPLIYFGTDIDDTFILPEGFVFPEYREPLNFGTCGDGLLEGTEGCDDGNTIDGDGCSATCNEEVVVEVCGNGILETGEECDDGNTSEIDGCTSQCLLVEVDPAGPVCGNNVIEGGESCDDGNTTNGDGCDSQCQTETPVTVECGNGILEAGEQCDDGNVINGDNCDSQCQYEDPTQASDLCLNLSGDQLTMPSGYERIGLNCYETDEEVQVACGEWEDVSDRDPEFEIWVWLCERDILKGHKDGSLRPDDSLTRAELLALAFRASDYENEFETDEDASYCFVDVDDEWFAQYACTAEDLGFVEGYSGNIFGPARKVILAEGLKMFLGALDEPFTINNNPNEWYYDMLFEAEDDDYLPYTLSDPQVVGPIELTRRKAANMLYRIMIYR